MLHASGRAARSGTPRPNDSITRFLRWAAPSGTADVSASRWNMRSECTEGGKAARRAASACSVAALMRSYASSRVCSRKDVSSASASAGKRLAEARRCSAATRALCRRAERLAPKMVP